MGGGNAFDSRIEPDRTASSPPPRPSPARGEGRSELLTPQELTAFSTVLGYETYDHSDAVFFQDHPSSFSLASRAERATTVTGLSDMASAAITGP